jgi:hypothetical protein
MALADEYAELAELTETIAEVSTQFAFLATRLAEHTRASPTSKFSGTTRTLTISPLDFRR